MRVVHTNFSAISLALSVGIAAHLAARCVLDLLRVLQIFISQQPVHLPLVLVFAFNVQPASASTALLDNLCVSNW